jgi:uncharacterized membrane protein
VNKAIETIAQFPDMPTDMALTCAPKLLLAQQPNVFYTDAPNLPVSMTAAVVDPYKKAGEKAAQEEDTSRQNPAIAQVPSREEQEAQRQREQKNKSATLEGRWIWRAGGFASALGSLGLRPDWA